MKRRQTREAMMTNKQDQKEESDQENKFVKALKQRRPNLLQ
jgi:hypothetical protein